MRRAHVTPMTRAHLMPLAAAVLMAMLVAGCTSTGTTGSGSVRGGAGSGWENFRADAGGAAGGPVS